MNISRYGSKRTRSSSRDRRLRRWGISLACLFFILAGAEIAASLLREHGTAHPPALLSSPADRSASLR